MQYLFRATLSLAGPGEVVITRRIYVIKTREEDVVFLKSGNGDC